MFGVICPTCAFTQLKTKSERLEIARKLTKGSHYICDSCGSYMYQSVWGTRWSHDMDDILFWLAEEDKRRVISF